MDIAGFTAGIGNFSDNYVMSQGVNWMRYPRKKQVLLVVAAWIVCTFLRLTVLTDMFRLSPATGGYSYVDAVSFVVTVIMLATVINYFRNKRIQKSKS